VKLLGEVAVMLLQLLRGDGGRDFEHCKEESGSGNRSRNDRQNINVRIRASDSEAKSIFENKMVKGGRWPAHKEEQVRTKQSHGIHIPVAIVKRAAAAFSAQHQLQGTASHPTRRLKGESETNLVSRLPKTTNTQALPPCRLIIPRAMLLSHMELIDPS
jgi:hypothetical protein